MVIEYWLFVDWSFGCFTSSANRWYEGQPLRSRGCEDSFGD